MLDALKNRGDAVVILRGDGIEFVVVAARAVHRQPEKHGARCADHVVQFIRALVGCEHRVFTFDLVHRTSDQKPRSSVLSKIVTCELILDKTVERPVLVERADHVVPVVPRVVPRLVHLEAVAFRKTRDIQPVPRPALAEAG